MGKKIHRTPPEVKADIIRRIKEEGVTVAQAAKDHGLHETTIYGWIGAGAQGAPSWSEFAKLQKQNRELLALVGEITLQLSNTQKKN
jgi:transposase-like protein